jgi:Tol biopolymer transport system component
MSLTSGTSLGPYTIAAKLGAGGMGEVYRATDTKLGRDVAIKVLPADVAQDAERHARFKREAQLLASLNHPSIAAIYGLDEAGDKLFLVLELVEGEDLGERLARGRIPVAEALEIARQIATGLEEAHEKGIVHRDLKPANVKLTPDGKVKVLDFGLAKALSSEVSGTGSPDSGNSPTMTRAATMAGMILGTAAYMSPEQARGKPADKRADIWAFGVVLAEMLSGEKMFDGETVSDTLAAVLTRDFDATHLPAGVSPAIRRLLRRCLAKNPKSRLHDIADARIVIEEVLAGKEEVPPSPAIAPPVPAQPRWGLAAACLAAGLVVGGLSGWLVRPAPARATPVLTQFQIRPPEGATAARGLALSPDGRKIAFVARGADGRVSIWVRALDALEARAIADTTDARFPFWAPDSRRLGFFSPKGLQWTDTLGGAPIVIAPTGTMPEVRGAAWGADDVILYTPAYTGPIFSVAAKGGATAPATRLDGDTGTTRFPSFLPDGKRFVFYASTGTGTEPGKLYLGRVGSLDAKLLGTANSSAVFAPPDRLLYARGDSMVAHRFDDRREELTGDPVPIFSMGGSLTVSGLRSIAVSRGGTLIFRDDKRGTNDLVWVDRKGEVLETISNPDGAWHYGPRISPDGRFVAVSHLEVSKGNGEVWIYDLERKLTNRLTTGEGDDYQATWVKPAGREVVYSSGRGSAGYRLYRIAYDGSGAEKLWIENKASLQPSATTPDGRRMVFEKTDDKGRISLWIGDLDGGGAPTRLTPESASESSADLSPDGRWLAFQSDVTRTVEVYVRRLDGIGGAIRISNAGGIMPLFGHDGRELFYLDPLGRIVAVPIGRGADLQPGAPTPLFAARVEDALDRQYDVSMDGQRFLLNRTANRDAEPITVVLDWSALMDRKSP